MSTANIVPYLSPQDYLLRECDGEIRHEYLNGEPVAMAGGSRAHNLLATRVARLFGNHLEGGPCRVYQSDMKVRIESANRFYYPDVMVCCGPVEAGPSGAASSSIRRTRWNLAPLGSRAPWPGCSGGIDRDRRP